MYGGKAKEKWKRMKTGWKQTAKTKKRMAIYMIRNSHSGYPNALFCFYYFRSPSNCLCLPHKWNLLSEICQLVIHYRTLEPALLRSMPAITVSILARGIVELGALLFSRLSLVQIDFLDLDWLHLFSLLLTVPIYNSSIRVPAPVLLWKKSPAVERMTLSHSSPL